MNIKINKRIFQKTLLSILLIASFMIISGCSKVDSENKNYDFEQIKSVIEKSINHDNMAISENPTKSLKRFYGLNFSDYKNVILYSPSSSMDVSELMIIKTSDDAQIETVEASIENRVASQLLSFSGYAPEQCDLIENYIIKIKDGYVFYAVGENAEDLKKAFVEAFQNND